MNVCTPIYIVQFIPQAISVHEQYTRCSYRVIKFRRHFLAIIVDSKTPVLDAYIVLKMEVLEMCHRSAATST